MSEAGGGLFGPVEARGLVAHALSDAAFVRAMLRVEAALASALADAGQIGREDADAIVGACRGPAPDAGLLGRGAPASGAPVVPMLDVLRDGLGPSAAAALHRGATTQDVMDTAMMLVASGAVRMLLADLEAVEAMLAELAARHATTPMIGRTLLQHARVTTFGATAAGWLAGVERAIDGLHRVRRETLALQLGGPVGTGAGLPPGVTRGVAERLLLALPNGAWHAERGRSVELASAVAVASSAVSKVALDLVLLAQTEVAEVRTGDAGVGGSSSMAHKRNPIGAVLARASAARVPGLLANIVAAAGDGELQRAAGAWHAEWRSLRELLLAAGSAAAWLRAALEHLEVDADAMRRNLALTGELAPTDAGLEAARAAAVAGAERGGARARARRSALKVHRSVDGPEGAPVVVLGNSLGSTLSMWDPIVAELAPHVRLVRYDLRGHGASPAPPGPYVIDDLADDLLALLDDIGDGPFHLVGTSIGGMAAMVAASREPERVDRLVLIGTSAHLGPPEGWTDRARTVLEGGMATIAETVPARWVTPSFAAAHPDALERFRAMFAAADPAGYAGCCLAIAGMDLRPRIGRITAPTLVVAGSDDPATPVQHAEEIVRLIPHARLHVLPAAHLPSVELPADVARLILEHLGVGAPTSR